MLRTPTRVRWLVNRVGIRPRGADGLLSLAQEPEHLCSVEIEHLCASKLLVPDFIEAKCFHIDPLSACRYPSLMPMHDDFARCRRHDPRIHPPFSCGALERIPHAGPTFSLWLLELSEAVE